MPKYWMITNRTADVPNATFGTDRGTLTYWVADAGPLDNFAEWTQLPHDEFKTALIAAASNFPALDHADNEDQSHVTFFVHGYNTGWKAAAARYQSISDSLFTPGGVEGLCVSFDWPSFGSVVDYLPDRDHARQSAADLATVLTELYDWLLVKQQDALTDPAAACRAKLSMIAHSMGNYVLQKALATVWTRRNQPLLVSLINQLLMVAADVDNDLFEPSAPDGSDGTALANLVYRATVLYSGRDAVLGASAGLKHFGTRRLGRSGLAVDPPTSRDNVWDVDCSGFFPEAIGAMSIHSAYFDAPGTIKLMAATLRGLDRSVMDARELTKGTLWPPVAGVP